VSKPILPKHLKEKIIQLFEQDHSAIEIFDLVCSEALSYVDSHEQLSKCISAVLRSSPSLSNSSKINPEKDYAVPKPKKFDVTRHKSIIRELNENMQEKEFENACHKIVMDILTNYEGFEDIEDVNKAPGFTNPPFDFFAFKDGSPYMIEFKGSLNNFNAPGEAQKRRLKELLDRIEGLSVALLQVKLKKGEYRIFYDNEMTLFFDGYKMPIGPIEKWIRTRLENRKNKYKQK